MSQHTINATDFKARCLDMLDRVNSGEIDEIAITKRGKVVARLVPPPPALESVESVFGWMKGTVTIPEGFDLTAPVFEGLIDARDGDGLPE